MKDLLNPKFVGLLIFLVGLTDWVVWLNLDVLLFNPFVATLMLINSPFIYWMGVIIDRDKKTDK